MYSAIAARSASGSCGGVADDLGHVEPTESKFGVTPVFSTSAMSPAIQSADAGLARRDVRDRALALGIGAAGKAALGRDDADRRCGRYGIRRNGRRPHQIGAAIPARGFRGIRRENLAVEEGEIPQPEPAPDVKGNCRSWSRTRPGTAGSVLRRRRGRAGPRATCAGRRYRERPDSRADRPARRRRAWRAGTAPRSRSRCRPRAARCSADRRCRRATAAACRRRAGCGRPGSGSDGRRCSRPRRTSPARWRGPARLPARARARPAAAPGWSGARSRARPEAPRRGG